MDGRDYAAWDGSLEWLHGTVDERRRHLAASNWVDEDEYSQKWWLQLDMPGETDELVIPMGRNEHKICREYPVQQYRDSNCEAKRS